MEKQTLKKVLDSFDRIIERDKQKSEAIKIYWKIVAPSNYSPFEENTELSGFLEGLKLGFPELAEELSDWLYQGYAIPSVWEFDGKKFRIDGYEDFKKYLQNRFCNC